MRLIVEDEERAFIETVGAEDTLQIEGEPLGEESEPVGIEVASLLVIEREVGHGYVRVSVRFPLEIV